MGFSEAMRQRGRGQRNKLLHGLLMIGVVVLCGYMIRDLWDDVLYELSGQKQTDLGRAEGVNLGEIVGNRDLYVKVAGIVSNRGAVVKAGKVGSMIRPERWYRQLVGCAAFLEIEVDDESKKQRYQMFTDVTVSGRGRLLRRSGDYDNIVTFFKKQYGYTIPQHAVVISVDHSPGSKYGAIIGSALLGLVACINVFLFIFVLRRKPRVVAG